MESAAVLGRVRDRGLRLARRAALRLAGGLGSVARFLAEWAGMHKRIEIIVTNPGFEGTLSALGSYTIDFQDEEALENAMQVLRTKLGVKRGYGPYAIFLRNEKGQERGFNPEHYVSHLVSDVQDWEDPSPFRLPEKGASAPPREGEG